MECPLCESQMRRFGHNRNGSQRHRCDVCRRTFTDEQTRPMDRRRLDMDKAVLALRHLLEGNSVRSTERLVEVHRDTILSVMVEAGENCQRFLESVVHRGPVDDVQADEIWSFVRCKEKTKQRNGYSEDMGDAWCFAAIERTSKMILAWHLGKRTPEDTLEFSEKLRRATSGRFQLSTDGYGPYRTEIPFVFGPTIDFAQLIKIYGDTTDEGRYSPGQVIDAYPVICTGQPDEERICTSHAERANLTMRMTLRRLTRLTNAHSKKWENHEAALALYFAFYNFCRVHSTIKSTPAVAAGLTDHTWSVKELLETASEND